MFELNAPVVICTFNRIEPTIRVFEQIRKVKPKVLYLVSDAPRKDRPDEEDKVIAVRNYLESHVDWLCDVRKIYSKDNMGCARRISSALDEVFSREESAIILEDDCLPADSFFEYCQTMLEWYKDDDRIMSVAGCPEIEYTPREDIDYFFSAIFLCCGWATWKRAWEKYDFTLSGFEKDKKEAKFKNVLFNKRAYWNYMAQFELLKKSEKKHSWAYQFSYMTIKYNGYTIVPKCNLICNLGFSDDSTHTSEKPDYFLTKTLEMSLPISKNDVVERNIEYDNLYFKLTQKSGLVVRIKQLLNLDINKSLFRG